MQKKKKKHVPPLDGGTVFTITHPSLVAASFVMRPLVSPPWPTVSATYFLCLLLCQLVTCLEIRF